MVKTGRCVVVFMLLLSITACDLRSFDTAQKPCIRMLKIAKKAGLYENIYVQCRKDYRLLTFGTEPIISTETEFDNKLLLSVDELYDTADRLNDYGRFGYIITKASSDIRDQEPSSIMIMAYDPESDIIAYISYKKIYHYFKQISFETAPGQSAEADKMLWFARLLFGNITEDVFSYFTKSGNISESHEYSYVNDEIRYSTYVSYSIHDYDFKRSQHVHYNLTYAYGPVAQYIHFLSDYAIPVKLAELPDYCPSKRYLKVEAYAAQIKLHESGEYYEAVLYDREGHSIKCQIDNIRTGDTYADIKNATTFVGGIWHEDCFEVSCYE